ncbi:MAG: RsbRD N-terminal domain-containing protein [Chloroflexia bacterium]
MFGRRLCRLQKQPTTTRRESRHIPVQSDLTWVLGALTSRRDDILGRWLDDSRATVPRGAARRAVADHIPELFDALVAAMERSASPRVGNQAPLEDEAVLHAAQAHAVMRVEQGFQPTDVLAEFRVLRHELWHALRQAVPDSAPVGDVVSAQLLLNDAIDGAVSLALVALTDRIYELREEFLATAVHEVRQPITLLSGYAQIAERVLSRPEPDLARARNAVVQIKAATLHMAAQLSALADASRSTLGQFTISPTAVDLATVVEESVAALGPTRRDGSKSGSRIGSTPTATSTASGCFKYSATCSRTR